MFHECLVHKKNTDSPTQQLCLLFLSLFFLLLLQQALTGRGPFHPPFSLEGIKLVGVQSDGWSVSPAYTMTV